MSNDKVIKELQDTGAHFAYSRTKRHPSAESFILGRKDTRDIFDLSKTAQKMDEAKEAILELLSSQKSILFVGTKNEARAAVKEVAEKLAMPYVNLRFIGGSLTNFSEIKKRTARLRDLRSKFAAGDLQGYTKKEKVMLEREMNKLEEKFSGIADMQNLPAMVVLVDPKHESIAAKEAKDMNIPIVAIANNDCDYSSLQYVIPANDSSQKAIKFILEYITQK